MSSDSDSDEELPKLSANSSEGSRQVVFGRKESCEDEDKISDRLWDCSSFLLLLFIKENNIKKKTIEKISK